MTEKATEDHQLSIRGARWGRSVKLWGCGFCATGILVVVVGLLVSGPNWVGNYLLYPFTKREMIRVTLEWARLAPLPSSAKGFRIYQTGNPSTRGFEAHFKAPLPEIELWLSKSPGIAGVTPFRGASADDWREAKAAAEYRLKGELPASDPPLRVRHYLVEPGGGAQFARVAVNEETGEVTIHTYWS